MHIVSMVALSSIPALLLLVFSSVLKRRRRLPQGTEPPPMVRTASLDTPEINDRGWRVGLLATLLLLAGTATLLAMRWHMLPGRSPVHWGWNGQPDRWMNRSFGSIFGPLLFTFVLVCGLGLLGELVARSSPGHEGRPALIKTTRTVVLACSWLVTLLLCSVSLLPLSHNPTHLVPFLSVAAATSIYAVAAYVAFLAIRMERIIVASQNSTEGRFWKAGLVYFNPQDSALMVPKRNGFGYTLNFGRPVCWVIFALLLLGPLLLPLFLHVSHQR